MTSRIGHIGGAHSAPRVRRMTLGESEDDENPERHRPGVNSEHPPRPLGVASGIPWEPREAERSHAMHWLTAWFLETFSVIPGAQRALSTVLGVLSKPYSWGDTPAPPDVTPEPGSWKFVAVGDYGAGTVEQARVAANIVAAKPQLVVTTGDNVYPTGRWEDYQRNFDPSTLMGGLARKIPFMPSLGNHDMYHDDLRPYFGHFPHLKGRPYYTFTQRDAQFFALDGDQDLRPGSAEYRWLERELKRSKARWKVVYLHYPMYGMKPDEFPEIRESIQPLLARYGVQLALTGHEHNYSRSHAIDGVTHIITGGGGQEVFQFTRTQPAWTARRAAVFHHTEISVGHDSLTVRAIDQWGHLIDAARIPWHGPKQAAEGVQALAPRHRARRRRHAHR